MTMLPASKEDELPRVSKLSLEKHSSCEDSCGDDTADTESVSSNTESVFSNHSSHTYSVNDSLTYSVNDSLSGDVAYLPKSCMLFTKKGRRNVTFCLDAKTQHGSPRAARHVLEEVDVMKMWYTESELKDIQREMIRVHAPSVVLSRDNPRASEWWKTLFYFHKETPAPAARDAKVLLMRAKLVMTYVEAHEIVGLERILLGLLNQGYHSPRRSLLDWIQAQRGSITTESIAAFQRRVSLPFRLFSRELAVALAEALTRRELPSVPQGGSSSS